MIDDVVTDACSSLKLVAYGGLHVTHHDFGDYHRFFMFSHFSHSGVARNYLEISLWAKSKMASICAR